MYNLDEFENIIGYKFNNKRLLEVALTHSSYGNEHNCEYNERMEFLGDAVLELAMSKYLYSVISLDEGVLTKQRAKTVCESALNIYAEKINLPKYLLLGNGEEATGGRKRPAIIAENAERKSRRKHRPGPKRQQKAAGTETGSCGLGYPSFFRAARASS